VLSTLPDTTPISTLVAQAHRTLLPDFENEIGGACRPGRGGVAARLKPSGGGGTLGASARRIRAE
jgi:hypothetical protein